MRKDTMLIESRVNKTQNEK